jgi:uncharacterized protein
MLTSDLVIPRVRFSATALSVAFIDAQDAHWQQTALELIALFMGQTGKTQAAWAQILEEYIGDRLDYIVIRGLAKVLIDAATFSAPPAPLAPLVVRERLFAYGPVSNAADALHPQTRAEVLQQAARDFDVSDEEVEQLLFADRAANAVLSDSGPAWTADALLARYNLELARGVLYWASQLSIEVSDSYKDLWKYLKLFKLMFEAEQVSGGYRLRLDGPISPFVKATTRYGRAFAAFMPALLLCERWRLDATVHPPQSFMPLTYRLDQSSALQSHFKRSGLFDSRLEADFAAEFEEKFGGARGHWQLSRESEVLLLGDTVMIPDFLLVDKDDEQRRVLIELVGFWHPNYLRRKVEKVRAARCQHLLLLVYKGLNLSAEAFEDTASEAIFFTRKPVVQEVMASVDALAERLYGPRPKKERVSRKRKTIKKQK